MNKNLSILGFSYYLRNSKTISELNAKQVHNSTLGCSTQGELCWGAAVKVIIFRGLRATAETGQRISGTFSDGIYTVELLPGDPVHSHLIQKIVSFYSRNICNLLVHLFFKQAGFQIN